MVGKRSCTIRIFPYDSTLIIFLGARFIRIISCLCDVNGIGISGLTRVQIQSAQAENQRRKLIGTLANVNGQIPGSVKPAKLDWPLRDPPRPSRQLHANTWPASSGL